MEEADITFLSEIALEDVVERPSTVRIGTPYGPSPPSLLGKVADRDVVFLPRNGERHDVPPHKINHLANIWSLQKLGVKRIVAIDPVRSISKKIELGEIVVPHDLIDFTKSPPQTFYDEGSKICIDLREPYCPEVRSALIEASRKIVKTPHEMGVYACTKEPRHETLAEVAMYLKLGCDVIGTSSIPEASLARELGICYASLCIVTDVAYEERHISISELKGTLKAVLKEAVKMIPERRKCECPKAPEKARMESLGIMI